jgi:hypothetical protein
MGVGSIPQMECTAPQPAQCMGSKFYIIDYKNYLEILPKDIVKRKLPGIKSGINGLKRLQGCGAGHYFFNFSVMSS